MRFCHHHLLEPSPALHWCKISPLFQFWPNLVQNLKPQPILHKYDPQVSAIFRKEALQPTFKSSLPANILQNSSCPLAFDSHQPNLNATKIPAVLPPAGHLSSAGESMHRCSQVSHTLSFCDSRKGNSMHCNVKTSHHSQQGDFSDVDESLGINTQSPPTHLLVA